MTLQIRDYLLQLYPPEQAESTYALILNRINHFQGKFPAQNTPLFSEHDVVLISYGDSLLRAGERPLQTLYHFARHYLADLISTIHILPFYPYSSDDGFSVIDYYSVNSDLGTWEDIQLLGHNFRLMFDAVINHMSAKSDWFQAFLADDPEFSGMFRAESPDTDLSSVTRPRISPLLTPFQKPNGDTAYIWTTFSADQVDLDYQNATTLIRVIDVLLFYLEKGARVIRLDAVAFLWKIPGTTCIHLEETHVVIRLLRALLDEIAPHVILITETNVPHQENISYFGDGYNEAQMVYNFTLPPLLLHTIAAGNAAKLRDWVNTLRTPSEQTTYFNFTASHDGIGVRPIEGMLSKDEFDALVAHIGRRGGRVSQRLNSDGSRSIYELNITYVDALSDLDGITEKQVRRFIMTQGIMLALAGVPAIYIHSLLGTHNNHEAVQRTGHNRAINRSKLPARDVEAELRNADSFRAQVFRAYTNLIKIRCQHTAFHPKAPQHALDMGDAVFALLRTSPDMQEQILVLCNVTDNPQVIALSEDLGSEFIDLLSAKQFSRQITLPPYQMLWLKRHDVLDTE